MVWVVFGMCMGWFDRLVVLFAAHSFFCGTKEPLERPDGGVGTGVEHWWDWFYEGCHKVP